MTSIQSLVNFWHQLLMIASEIKSTIFQFFGSHLQPSCHPLSSISCQISHFELTWTWVFPESAAAARASVFDRKSWVLKLKPARSEHPIQRPIQPRNNGVEGSSTFTGLITHLTGTHARLNSCIMSAVWSIALPAHYKHYVSVALSSTESWNKYLVRLFLRYFISRFE